jgi:glycyl-tRNA synthetase beta chain
MGISRLLCAGGHAPVPPGLRSLLEGAARALEGTGGFDAARGVEEALRLVEGRFRTFLETRGILYDEANAVLAAGIDDMREALGRAEALHAVRAEGALEGLVVPFKRARNILRQAEEGGEGIGEEVEEDLLQEEAEQELHRLLLEVRKRAEPLLVEGSYGEALREMMRLRPAVDRLFDEVMVMSEERQLRANRIALLGRVIALFVRIADIGEIVLPGES